MRRISLLVAVMLGALTCLALAAPAAAGGPTSVLLVAADRDVAKALRITQAAYTQLEDAVGDPSTWPTGESGGYEDHGEGSLITATWLIHDVHVWRVDQIYLDAAGGPWVSTVQMDSNGRQLDAVLWHKVPRPEALVALLGRLGLTGTAAGVEDANAAADDAADDAANSAANAAANAAANSAAVREPSMTTGWRWAVPGVVLGVLGTVLVMRRSPRRRREEPAPSQQLVDEPVGTMAISR